VNYALSHPLGLFPSFSPNLAVDREARVAPLTLPILPVKTFMKYSNFLGIVLASIEGKPLAELPQFFADMFGWENMAETVSRIYYSIPQDARSKTIIIVRNYGEAGSLEYYKKKYQLPRVISTQNNYWLWRYGSDDVETAIILGGDEKDYIGSFKQVEQDAVAHCNYSMPYGNRLPVYICRGPKVELGEIWGSLVHFE